MKPKSGNGYCVLKIYENRPPLVIYPVDHSGDPILDKNEIILIALSSIGYGDEDYYGGNDINARLCLHGKNYQFIRGELLERNHNEKKTKLTLEQHNKLIEIVNKKLEDIEEASLERRVRW